MQKSLFLISYFGSGLFLDFWTKFIVIDRISNLIQQYKALKVTKKLYQIADEENIIPWPELEPSSTSEATKQAVTIIDAK
jgi:hypothetical protein